MAKKWATRTENAAGFEAKHRSQKAAYEYVWSAPATGLRGRLDVLVDEGKGWQLYERFTLTDDGVEN